MSASTQLSGLPIDTKTPEEKKPREDPNQSEKVPIPNNGGEGGAGEDQEDEEELGECGFCLFMKGGGCKEPFTAWEKCVEEAEKNKEDVVEKCFKVTSALKMCMEAHSDYYEPLLKAEKAAEEEAIKELEKEDASMALEQNAGPKDSEKQGLSDDKRDG